MTLDVLFEDARWKEVDLEVLSERAEEAVLGRFGLVAEECEGSVLACDDAKIAELNADFREKDKATNVLSWPAQERGAEEGQMPELPQADVFGAIELGDIAISYDTCRAEAVRDTKSFEDHVTHLLVHGMLHLLGFDHLNDQDAVLMEGIETELLETLGISDPYKPH
jgi:probable rRNA maturation factor